MYAAKDIFSVQKQYLLHECIMVRDCVFLLFQMLTVTDIEKGFVNDGRKP